MNRRAFFGLLAAAPAAAVAALRPAKRTIVRYLPLDFCHDRLGGDFYGEPLVETMRKAGETAGESFRMSKGLASFEGIVGRKGT